MRCCARAPSRVRGRRLPTSGFTADERPCNRDRASVPVPRVGQRNPISPCRGLRHLEIAGAGSARTRIRPHMRRARRWQFGSASRPRSRAESHLGATKDLLSFGVGSPPCCVSRRCLPTVWIIPCAHRRASRPPSSLRARLSLSRRFRVPAATRPNSAGPTSGPAWPVFAGQIARSTGRKACRLRQLGAQLQWPRMSRLRSDGSPVRSTCPCPGLAKAFLKGHPPWRNCPYRNRFPAPLRIARQCGHRSRSPLEPRRACPGPEMAVSHVFHSAACTLRFLR